MRNLKTISILLVCSFLFISSNIQSQVDSLNKSKQKDTLSKTSVVVQPDQTEKPKADKKVNLKPPSIEDIISVGKIFWAIIFFIVGSLIIKFVTKILDLFAEKSTNYRITIKGFIPVVRILGWAFIFYIIINGIFSPPAKH